MLVSLLTLTFAADIRVDVLDVGQGDSILIRTAGNKVILIDASEAGADVIGQLRKQGVDHLDLAIATHPHADHIGGMQKVIEALPPKVYVDSGMTHTTQTYTNLMVAIEANAIAYKTAVTGMSFNLDDGAKLNVLFPGPTPLKNTRSDLNANSVVTQLIHGDDCFLFTGDAEEPTERALLNAGLGQCDVLKVAHHGSQYSTTAAFLAAVAPEIAVISCGAGNRHEHPGPDTHERIRQTGAQIYRTDESGRITLISTGKGIRVQPEHAAVAVPGTPAPWQAGGAVALAPAPLPEPLPEPAPIVPTPTAPKPQPKASAPTTAAPAANLSGVATSSCAFPSADRKPTFHTEACKIGAKISADERVCFSSRSAALGAGRRPAKCCKP